MYPKLKKTAKNTNNPNTADTTHSIRFKLKLIEKNNIGWIILVVTKLPVVISKVTKK